MLNVLEGMSRVLKVDRADLMLQTEGMILQLIQCQALQRILENERHVCYSLQKKAVLTYVLCIEQMERHTQEKTR